LRKEVKWKVVPLLWIGDVHGAIEVLLKLDPKYVRNPEVLTKLILYLIRNSPYIHNYSLRRLHGLRNSSNCVECANNVLVSIRQKRNGMSWSERGSLALAFIKSLILDNDLSSFIRTGKVNFKIKKIFVPSTE
jgi:hypothetical protein